MTPLTSAAENVCDPVALGAPHGTFDDAAEAPANLPPVAVDRASLQDTNADGNSKLPAPACDPVPALPRWEMGSSNSELTPSVPKGKSQAQWERAQRRLTLVQTYQELQRAGNTPGQAADAMRAAGLKGSRSRYDAWSQAFAARGFAGLFDNSEKAGRPRRLKLHGTEIAALKAARLTTNRTEHDGSTPEAVRLANRRGQLRPEIAAEFFERERTGRMVPKALHCDLVAGPAVTKQHRNPTDAGLDYLSAGGSLMWLTDELTGERHPMRVGDCLEADDATINFPVCIPWPMGGDRCSERWGVRVARFQWLVAIDRASRFVPGYRYTARPKSSYRAEDIAGLFHGVFRQHGVWKRLCLERGTWESKLITELLRKLRIERMTAWSPHQKPFIEGLFNLIWTKLSDMPGQVGRFMGEEEETNRVLTSCREGATDPRTLFPMLGDACAAFDRALAERNAQPVKSKHWGTWVPEERWQTQQDESRKLGRLRGLPGEAAWMFAPAMREWTVRGNTVAGSVQLAEGWSVEYEFAADWLTRFAGQKVRVHFDPFAPSLNATIVLLQNTGEHNAGEVLGVAEQTNVTANEARRALGYGDDVDRGLDIRRRAAIGMRSETRTLLAGGKIGRSATEVRLDLGNVERIERESGSVPATPPPPDRRLAASLTPPRRGRRAADDLADLAVNDPALREFMELAEPVPA